MSPDADGDAAAFASGGGFFMSPGICHQNAFHVAWFVSLTIWYAYLALLMGFLLWPSVRRMRTFLGHLIVACGTVALMALFGQTFKCQMHQSDGTPTYLYENRRAFPSIEGVFLAFLCGMTLQRQWLLPLALQGYQRVVVFVLVAAVTASLTWFHSLLQLGLSLLIGAAAAYGWTRINALITRLAGRVQESPYYVPPEEREGPAADLTAVPASGANAISPRPLPEHSTPMLPVPTTPPPPRVSQSPYLHAPPSSSATSADRLHYLPRHTPLATIPEAHKINQD